MLKNYIYTLVLLIGTIFSLHGQVYNARIVSNGFVLGGGKKANITIHRIKMDLPKRYSFNEILEFAKNKPELLYDVKALSFTNPLADIVFVFVENDSSVNEVYNTGKILGMVYGAGQLFGQNVNWNFEIAHHKISTYSVLIRYDRLNLTFAIVSLDTCKNIGLFPNFVASLRPDEWPTPIKVISEAILFFDKPSTDFNKVMIIDEFDDFFTCYKDTNSNYDPNFYVKYNFTSNQWLKLEPKNEVIKIDSSLILKDSLLLKKEIEIRKDTCFLNVFRKFSKNLKITTSINEISVIKEPSKLLIHIGTPYHNDPLYIRYDFINKKWYNVTFKETLINTNSK